MKRKAISLAIRGIPKVIALISPEPPKTDFSRLEHLLEEQRVPTVGVAPEVEPVEVTPTVTDRSSACVPCTRSHLSTISGSLSEALRFAREGGIAHPEVQSRLMTAEEEVNVMERYDLAPSKVMATEVTERQIIQSYLPRIRKLRQDMGDIKSVDDLERAAGEAQQLGQEFRLAVLQAKGINLKPIIDLAEKVDKGEMSMEEAKATLSAGKPVPGSAEDYPELTAKAPITQVKPTIDEALTKFEAQQKEIAARTKYGLDVTKVTEAEFVKAGLAKMKTEAKAIGFPLAIKRQTQELKREYAKLREVAIPKAPTEKMEPESSRGTKEGG